MSQKKRYEEERAKYDHITLDLGWYKKKSDGKKMEITKINIVGRLGNITLRLEDGHEMTKTLHWCRKRLERI